jgi:hypothetical protein
MHAPVSYTERENSKMRQRQEREELGSRAR